MDINDVLVTGRSRDNARRLLQIARDQGLEPGVVRTTEGGYMVPEAVAAAYEGKAAPKPEAEPDPEPEPKKKPAAKRRRKKSEDTTEDNTQTQEKE